MTIEISVFKLVSGVEADEFQVAACEATHHLQQFEGFHSRELYHDLETGQWTDVLHWESREDAIRASERVRMSSNPSFRKLTVRLWRCTTARR